MFLHTKDGLLRVLKVSICPSSTGLSFQHVYTHTGTSSYMHFVWKLQLDLLHVYIIWIRSTATIPGQIWRQYEGPQMAF